MKTLINTLIIVLTFSSFSNAQASLTIDEFDILNNTQWVGELMYVNYSDDKEVILQTTMQIDIVKNKIIMSTQYGNEPEANSKSSIKLKKNGTHLGPEKIIEKTQLDNGATKVVTSYEGSDANKPATLYITYLFNSDTFSMTKEVAFKDGSKKIIRNRYTYTKIQ